MTGRPGKPRGLLRFRMRSPRAMPRPRPNGPGAPWRRKDRRRISPPLRARTTCESAGLSRDGAVFAGATGLGGPEVRLTQNKMEGIEETQDQPRRGDDIGAVELQVQKDGDHAQRQTDRQALVQMVGSQNI